MVPSATLLAASEEVMVGAVDIILVNVVVVIVLLVVRVTRASFRLGLLLSENDQKMLAIKGNWS